MGSHRKGHLILLNLIGLSSLLSLTFMWKTFGKYFICACITLLSLTISYCDCITDALMIETSNTYKKDTSKLINGWCYIFACFGTIFGSFLACVTQNEGYQMSPTCQLSILIPV